MTENTWWPCCEHCGPLTEKAHTGAKFGNGYGHDEPCNKCEVAR